MTWTLILQIAILAVIAVFTFAILWGVTRQSKNRIVLTTDEHIALIDAIATLHDTGKDERAETLNALHKRIGEE